jgi:flavin reductase (NADH)
MTTPLPTPSHDDFRGALGSWVAGVTVVATRVNGLTYGITVSSFSSVSLDPLLISVCLADSNKLPNMIRESKHFAVSILAEGQEEISARFATSKREPTPDFEFPYLQMHTGSPIVKGAIAHLDCVLEQTIPGGDHTIAIGRVVGAAADPTKRPLIYYRRGYRQLQLD